MTFIDRLKNGEFSFIAGPCVVQDTYETQLFAERLKNLMGEYEVNWAFKASFDKANRSSVHSQRGAGLEDSFNMFQVLWNHKSIATVTDVHEGYQAEIAPVQLLQIPAFLCRQTDLLRTAALTGKPIAVKRGQFVSPEDTVHIVEKLKTFGAKTIILLDRGYTFGYNNLIVDMRGLEIMKKLNPDAHVFLDCTHSTQYPGGGQESGGAWEHAFPLARAATAVGVDGLFFETHWDPQSSPSDKDCMIPETYLRKFIEPVLSIRKAVEPWIS